VILDQKVSIPAQPDRVWDFLMDVPTMSRCVPGVETVEEIDEDTFIGALKVRVGPISVKLEGKATITERNRDEWRARAHVEAADRRIRGAVNANSTLELHPAGDGITEMTVHTDAAVLGKLGEFGQAIMRRKADQIMAQFVENMAKEIGSEEPSSAG
jgi:uncharacterized protein